MNCWDPSERVSSSIISITISGSGSVLYPMAGNIIMAIGIIIIEIKISISITIGILW